MRKSRGAIIVAAGAIVVLGAVGAGGAVGVPGLRAIEVPGLGWMAGERGDEGKPEEIAEIRAVTARLLEEYLAIQQIEVPIADVAPRLRRIFTATAVDEQISLFTRSLRDQREHIRDLVSFTDVRIQVEEWRGARVAGDRATAIAKGTEGLLFPDGWDDREFVWRVELRKEGAWKMDRYTFDDLQL